MEFSGHINQDKQNKDLIRVQEDHLVDESKEDFYGQNLQRYSQEAEEENHRRKRKIEP